MLFHSRNARDVLLWDHGIWINEVTEFFIERYVREREREKECYRPLN